jgi:hypothetical protein
MRSGSTLLQHILDQHSQIDSYSDLSSIPQIPLVMLGIGPKNICIKPVDLFFLYNTRWLFTSFEKMIWIARDPRDSYTSAIESGYAYILWLKGQVVEGIDTGLLDRWRKVYERYLEKPEKWYLVKYEDLTTTPDAVIAGILDYLELPQEQLLPFKKYKLSSGGDYKIVETKTVSNKSVGRYKKKITPAQAAVIEAYLAPEMKMFGYTK